MLIEQCQLDLDIRKFKGEKCQQDLYCYFRSSICPHCEHVNSQDVMDEGVTITEVILVDLNRKTRELEVYC